MRRLAYSTFAARPGAFGVSVVLLYSESEAPVKFAQTIDQTSAYQGRYAAALYAGGGGFAPRSGLTQHQYYAGRILSGGRFHVLKPDRICSVSEFLSFQMVSRQWSALSEVERALLVMTYSQTRIALSGLTTKWTHEQCEQAVSDLILAGYLRWAEPGAVELTLVGEAEVRHQIQNLGAGDHLARHNGGLRLRHYSLQDHEIELGRTSTLSIRLDGILVRVFTLKQSGAVIRVDHDSSNNIYMNSVDRDRSFAQIYVDLAPSLMNPCLKKREELP